MAELKFHKDRNRPRPVKETKITKPKEKFSARKESTLQDHKMGRPRKNKKYGSIRTEINNVMLLDALQNTLGYDTQDEILHHLLIQARNSLNDDQTTMLDTFLKVYHMRYTKHHK